MKPTFVELFAWTVSRFRERPALHDSRGMRTFGELDQRTDALAAHLQERVAPGSRVGIHMKNRIEWAEGLVAAHKAGVPAVPITRKSVV